MENAMKPNEVTREEKGLAFVLRALKSPNYRLFFFGQGISLIGTWMQQIAMSWLIYRLTGSALSLGMIGFLGQAPIFLLAPLAGIWADQWDRRKIVMLTQVLSMLEAFLLAGLVLTGTIQIWHIYVLTLVMGSINAFDMPVRQAFTIDMVDRREDLSNAIALNSVIFNGARLVGPSIAGLLIAAWGEGVCFILNSISYVTAIIALVLMKVNKKAVSKNATSFFEVLKEGFAYAYGFSPIKWVLMLLSITSFAGMSTSVLLPVFAAETLGGGPDTLGFLMGASGIGAVSGAIYLASRTSSRGLEKVLTIAAGVLGVGLMLLSLVNVLWIAMLIMMLTGFGMIVQVASSNTILQHVVEEDKRGRVMGFYTMAFIGMGTVGNLWAGYMAHIIGTAHAFQVGGTLCIVAGALFAGKLSELRKIITAHNK
jgi:MFS family permease